MSTDPRSSPRHQLVSDAARALFTEQAAKAVTVANTPAWRQRLHDRGVTDDVIDECEFQPEGAGWQYPTPGNDAHRWKAYSSQAKPKYKWVPGKSDYPYYHRPDLSAAVRDAGGDCWFVTESDLWVMLSAGIRNAVATYHELAFPESFPEWLDTLGVKRLLLAPDLDETGSKRAQLVVNTLADSPVEVVVFQLPQELGAHGDVTTLWQHPQYHGSGFVFRLLTLPQCTPKPTTPAPTPAPPRLPDDADSGWLDELNPIIAAGLGVSGWRDDGTSKPINCPNPKHQDDHASAFWHRDKHFCYCNTCGETWLSVMVADWLGIDWRAVKHQYSESSSAPSLAAGLPNAIREGLLSRGMATTARALDALLLAGVTAGDVFCINRMVDAGVSKSTAYRVVQENIDGTVIFSRSDSLTNTAEGYPDNSGKNTLSRRGRPPTYYVMPSVHELASMLGIPAESLKPGDELPAAALSSSKQYRVALHRKLIERRPGVYYRKALGARLGVRGRSTNRYDEPAGVVVSERWSAPVELTRTSVSGFHVERRYGERITDTTGKRWPSCRSGLEEALKRSERHSGKAVAFLECQQPNRYHVDDNARAEADPVSQPLTPAVRELRRVTRRAAGDQLRERLSDRREHQAPAAQQPPPEELTSASSGVVVMTAEHGHQCPNCGREMWTKPSGGRECVHCGTQAAVA